MPNRLKTQIAEAVEYGFTLAEVLTDFSEHDQWEVRTLYAEAKRRLAMQTLDEAAAKQQVAPAELSKRAVSAFQAGWVRPVVLNFADAPPATPRFEQAGRTILIGSDIHAPDHDPDAIDLFIQIGQAVGADEVILNGDVFDVAACSRFVPGATQHLRWVEERAEALIPLVEICRSFPTARKRMLPGNHDIRPQNWINANAVPLQGMFSLADLLGITDPRLGLELVLDGRIMLADGNLMVKHGTVVSGAAGHSVKKEVDKAGCSVVMGHVHRRAQIEVTKVHGELTGIELGCLCSLTPHYGNKEDVVNWQQGFAVVTEYEDGEFSVEMVKIKDGRATFRGRRFVSRLLDN